MSNQVDYHELCCKLHDFCINCGDNLFTEFVWLQNIKRLQKCNDQQAAKIIKTLKDTNILIVNNRRLMLNKNVHRNVRYMVNT